MRWIWAAACAVCVALTAGPGWAAPKAPLQQWPLVGAIDRCRQIKDAAQRLSCYDLAAGALVQAANSGQVRVVDRAQIQQAKRSLFGFQMPRLSLFSGDRSDDSADRLETTVKSAEQLNSGRYRVVLTEGGAIWETLEDKLSFDEPKRGQKIVILRGSLGSYFMQVNGQVGIRARRVG